MLLDRQSLVLSLIAGLVAASPAVADDDDDMDDMMGGGLSFETQNLDDEDNKVYRTELTASGDFVKNYSGDNAFWRGLFQSAQDRGDDFKSLGGTYQIFSGDELLFEGEVKDQRSYRGLLSSLVKGKKNLESLDIDRIVWSFDFMALQEDDDEMMEVLTKSGDITRIDDSEVLKAVDPQMVPLPGAGALALVGLGAVASRRRR